MFFASAAFFFVTASATASENARPATKPNIVVIVTDDQGYADLSSQEILDDVKTPHLDRLADSGVRCTAGYITSPQCSPSRAGLITGRHQARFGVEEISLCPLPADEITIAERLRPAGYRTGFVGKWHLDVNILCGRWLLKNLPTVQRAGRGFVVPPRVNVPFTPHAQGFDDYYDGEMKQYHTNFNLDGDALSEPKMVRDERFRVDVQSDAAVAFIDKNHDEPFYLHLCYYAPHVPLEATADYLDRFPGDMPERRRTGLAMISAVDDGVGRIMAKLKQHGIENDTLIFFVSDNGAPLKGMKDVPLSAPGGAWDGSRNDPLAGEKGMLLEGGIRVPYLVAWPSHLPAGRVEQRAVSSLDITATAITAAGLPLDPALDGVDLGPGLRGEHDEPFHEALFWRFWGQTAVRSGNWKLVRLDNGKKEMLYDIENDISESNNVIDQHPGMANELRQRLADWESQMSKPLPRGGLNQEEIEFYKIKRGKK